MQSVSVGQGRRRKPCAPPSSTARTHDTKPAASIPWPDKVPVSSSRLSMHAHSQPKTSPTDELRASVAPRQSRREDSSLNPRTLHSILTAAGSCDVTISLGAADHLAASTTTLNTRQGRLAYSRRHPLFWRCFCAAISWGGRVGSTDGTSVSGLLNMYSLTQPS